MNRFSDEPRVWPAPSCLENLAGRFFVSKSRGEFAEYLQLDGTWGFPCFYFPNEAAAQQALSVRLGSTCPPLPSNSKAVFRLREY